MSDEARQALGVPLQETPGRWHRASPETRAPVARLARVEATEGHYAAAERWPAVLAALGAEQDARRLALAIAVGRDDRARARELATEPEQEELRMRLAASAAVRPSEAAQILEPARTPDARLARAHLLRQAGQAERALEVVNELLGVDLWWPEALVEKACVQMQLERSSADILHKIRLADPMSQPSC